MSVDRASRGRPNPFYAALVLASTAFVVTALAYYVSPLIAQQAVGPAPVADRPGPGSIALVAWFDRWGTLALGVEFAIMLASGLLAMATDRTPSPRPPSPRPPSAG